MDRDFSELMSEALALDTEHKRTLAEALNSDLSLHRMEEQTLRESERRRLGYERGEIAGTSGEEAMERVRRLRQQ